MTEFNFTKKPDDDDIDRLLRTLDMRCQACKDGKVVSVFGMTIHICDYASVSQRFGFFMGGECPCGCVLGGEDDSQEGFE